MTKAEAIVATLAFSAQASSSINLALETAARSGLVGGVFPYNLELVADMDDTVSKLQKAGWTVTIDKGAKTLVVS